MTTEIEQYWSAFGRDWGLISSPLRPCQEDTELMAGLVADWCRDSGGVPLRAGILGVTPEIVTMDWPKNSKVTAFDRMPGMITSLWPQQHLPGIDAVCCDWRALPLADSALQVVAGDGSFSMLPFPDGVADVARELGRVIEPDGLLVVRCFLLPTEPDSVEAVFDDLFAGRINSFHAFKWRLLMALQASPGQGVCVGKAWDAWCQYVPSTEALARSLGWPLPVVAMIEKYRDAATVYTYHDQDSLCDVLKPYFRPSSTSYPSYQYNQCYPTLCFTRI